LACKGTVGIFCVTIAVFVNEKKQVDTGKNMGDSWRLATRFVVVVLRR
jgi:hypothetical protein